MKQDPSVSSVGKPAMTQSAGNSYLYEKIYLELKSEILAGTYAEGDWFPPERTLKDRFGTTHLTVRNALAKLVLEGYIERYSGKGTIVIYSRKKPNAEVPLLRFPYAQLILTDIDESAGVMISSIEQQLRRLSLPLRVSLHRGDPDMEKTLYMAATRDDALAILLPLESPTSLAYSGMELKNTILISEGGPVSNCPHFRIDSASGAGDAVKLFLKRGYQDIALIVSPSRAPGFREGWESELSAAGIEAGPALQASCVDNVDSAATAALALLARRPSCRAFLCGSDRIAAGVVRALRVRNLFPGADYGVIGYGDTCLAESLDLSSIDPRMSSIGELVAVAVADGMRLGRLADDTQRVVPRIINRASTFGQNIPASS